MIKAYAIASQSDFRRRRAMHSFWPDVFDFFVAYLSHWQSYATGGVVTGVIAVGERLSGKQLPKKVYATIFVGIFSLVAFFLAWRDQYTRANNLAENSAIAKKESPFSISPDNEFASITNTIQAFRFLAPQQSNACLIKITAPKENKQVASILSNLGSTFCRVDWLDNPAAPEEEVLRGSVRDALLIHMAKEPPKDGFLVALGNAFKVRRSYDLPAGSPDGLVWIQIGQGSPWRKDPTKPGTD
jgi:hypothetical protein